MSWPTNDEQVEAERDACIARLKAISAASEAKRAARVPARYKQVEETLQAMRELGDLDGPLEVPLSNSDQVAWIDPEDWDKIKRWSWSRTMHGYAQGGQRLMHRLIMGATHKHEVVDHINRNRLDNRKANLRIVTSSENAANRERLLRQPRTYKPQSPPPEPNKRRGKGVTAHHRMARYWAEREAQSRPDTPPPGETDR